MNKLISIGIWLAVALLGAGAFGYIAVARGETISAAWLIIAAVCSYLVAYRFYSRFIANSPISCIRAACSRKNRSREARLNDAPSEPAIAATRLACGVA